MYEEWQAHIKFGEAYAIQELLKLVWHEQKRAREALRQYVKGRRKPEKFMLIFWEVRSTKLTGRLSLKVYIDRPNGVKVIRHILL